MYSLPQMLRKLLNQSSSNFDECLANWFPNFESFWVPHIAQEDLSKKLKASGLRCTLGFYLKCKIVALYVKN